MNSTFDRCRIGMTAALAVSIFLMAPSAARSQDESEAVSFSLSAEQEGAPQSVSVSFATEVSATELASFAVELDEVDVTRLITNASAKGFDVRPAKPLGPGRHELRLYRLTPDRQGFELVAVWPFEIARDEGWSLVSADIAAEHAVSYNVRGDHNWAAANSAGRLSGRAENGNWRADADLQYLAASERRQRLDDTAVDIGSYAASLSHSGELVSSAVELGHQTIDADPLLISSLNRRGLSASVQTNNKAYGATVFGVRSLESQTADNFTGLGDADEQLFGGTVFVTPLQAGWGTVRTSLSAYRGEGATLGNTATGEADGVAGAIEVDAFEDRADLVVGFAHSRTDIDGSGSLFSRQNDNALSAELNVVVIKPDPGDTGQLSWTNTYQRIGSNFFSFANPFLTNDLEEVSTGLEYAGRSLTLRGEVARQENNVTGNAALPTDRAVLTRINGAYFPFATSEAPDWLGQLTVSFGAESGWTDRIRNTDTSVDVDARSTQIYLGLSAATQSLAWGVTGAVSDFEDNGNASADQRTWSSLGFVNWVPADWFNADASVQWQHGRTQTGRSDDITVDLSATAWVIEDTLSTSAGYAGAFSSERDGYEGWENYLELNWVPRKGHSLAVRAGAAGGDSIRELSRDDRPELFGRVVYRVSTDFSR